MSILCNLDTRKMLQGVEQMIFRLFAINNFLAIGVLIRTQKQFTKAESEIRVSAGLEKVSDVQSDVQEVEGTRDGSTRER